MKKGIFLTLMLVLCIGLSACGCEHEWQAADCEHPRTCALCGKTEGETLSHSWQAADCEHPRTCTLCGKTEGEALGHTEGDWEKAKADYIKAEQHYEKKCSRCGLVTDQKTEVIEQLHNGRHFLLTAADFTERADYVLRQSQQYKMNAEIGFQGEDYVCIFMTGKTQMGNLAFLSDQDGDGEMEFRINNGTFESLFGGAQAGEISEVFLAELLKILNPAITDQEISELFPEILETMKTKEPVRYNGLAYSLVDGNEQVFFVVAIPKN